MQRNIFDKIVDYKYFIIFIVILSTLLALFYVKYVPKVYRSYATMQIQSTNSDDKLYENYLQTQIDFLQSKNLISKVINTSDESLNKIQKNLKIIRNDDKSSFITLSYDGSSPTKAKEFLEKLIDIYLSLVKKVKNTEYLKYKKVLDHEIKIKKDKLEEIQNKIVEFSTKNKVANIKKQTNNLIDTISKKIEKVSILNTKLETLKMAFRTIRDTKDYKSVLTLLSDLDNKNLSILVNKITEDEKEYEKLKQKYKDLHPLMIKLKNKIFQNQKTLKINLVKLYKSTKKQRDILSIETSKEQNILNTVPQTEISLDNLQREYNQVEKEYLLLLDKSSTLDLNEKIKQNYIYKIIDNPSLPKYYIFPKSKIVLLLGMVLGFIFSLIIVLLREFFKQNIVTQKDIKELTNNPILGVLPNSKNKKVSTSYMVWYIRNALEKYKLKDSLIISLSSYKYHEDKTLLTSYLASSLGNGDQKVLIVSLDFRHPEIHKQFGISNKLGITSVLYEYKDINSAIQKVKNHKNLYLLPCGEVIQNPANIINSKYFPQIIDELRKVFDYIIFDLSPILEAPESLYIMRYSDLNAFILKSSVSQKSSIKYIENATEQNGIKNIAYILTDAKRNDLQNF